MRGEAPLKHGDEIALGATKGRFAAGGAALPAPPPGPGAWVNPAPALPPASPMAQSHHQMPPPGQAPGYQGKPVSVVPVHPGRAADAAVPTVAG